MSSFAKWRSLSPSCRFVAVQGKDILPVSCFHRLCIAFSEAAGPKIRKPGGR